jgi:hypothetical protein
MLPLGCRLVSRCRAHTTDLTIAGEAAISIFVDTLKMGLMVVFKARNVDNGG